MNWNSFSLTPLHPNQLTFAQSACPSPFPPGELWLGVPDPIRGEGKQRREEGSFVTESSTLGPFPAPGPRNPKGSAPLQPCLEASCGPLPPWCLRLSLGLPPGLQAPLHVPLSFLNRQENKQLISGYYISCERDALIRKISEGGV